MIKKIFLSLAFILFLTACSLAEDVTPPPGYKPQVQATFAPAGGSQPTAAAPLAPNPNATPVDVSNAFPSTRPSTMMGAAVFAKNCTRCHGTKGAGDGQLAPQIQVPMPNFTKIDLARSTTPQRWYGLITNGNLDRFMPPWTSLSDAERWSLVTYLYTLSTPPVQIEAGRKVFDSTCQSCHGPDGKGAVTKVDFTNPAFVVKKSNNDLFDALGKVPAHKLEAVSDTDRRAVIDYVRSLSADATSITMAASKGSVNGKIENGTPGGPTVGDLPVVLNIFDNFKPSEVITVTAKSDGTFTFPEVALNENRAFIVSVKYNGLTYVSDVGSVTSGTATYNLPVQVFDTTSNPVGLRIDQMHLVFEFQNSLTNVGELIAVSNLSDRTFVAAKEGDPTLTFTLPTGFSNLSFDDGALGGRYKQAPNGFADTSAIRPGTGNYQIVVYFSLPYTDSLSFAQPAAYATKSLSVLLPDVGVTLANSNFVDQGIKDMQGSKFRMYTLTDVKAGDVIKFDLKGKPAAAAAGGAATSAVIFDSTSAIIGGTTLALALAIVALYYWNQKQKPAPAVSGKARTRRREELIAEIADLDEGFEKGEYAEAEYKAERAKLKAELKAILEKEKSN